MASWGRLRAVGEVGILDLHGRIAGRDDDELDLPCLQVHHRAVLACETSEGVVGELATGGHRMVDAANQRELRRVRGERRRGGARNILNRDYNYSYVLMYK